MWSTLDGQLYKDDWLQCQPAASALSIQAHNKTVLRIGTGHWANGPEKYYCIHPEELFLFLLTKCMTGMTNKKIVDMFFGGDYN